MSDRELRALAQDVVTQIAGPEAALDGVPTPAPLQLPQEPAARAALVRIAEALAELQRAVEAYQIATGTWQGRPKIAVSWSTPPASAGAPGQDQLLGHDEG